VYLLDQNLGIETMMFFDMDDIAWMSAENLPRFLVYRCSSISRFEKDGTQRQGIGLIADQATGNVLPAGEINFSYCLLQRPLTRLITEQEAVSRWMEALLPLFEENFPGRHVRLAGRSLPPAPSVICRITTPLSRKPPAIAVCAPTSRKARRSGSNPVTTLN